MAKIYYHKITNGALNPNTEEVWKIDDVPVRWRNEVQKLIDMDNLI